MAESVFVKKRELSLEKIKTFTDLLFSKDYSYEKILKLEKSDDFSNFKYRLINMVSNYPKLLWYINKYLNSIYVSNLSNCEMYDSLRTIIRYYGITSKNELRYAKYKIPERKNFKTSLSDVFENLSNNDLNELYRLYCAKIIKNIDFAKTSDKKIVINSIEENYKKKEPKKAIDKHELNKNIQAVLESKPTCKSCKYFKSEKLFIDGNISSLDNIHMLFLNEFSTIEEFNRGKIFFKDDDIPHINYLIINVLPCNIQNDISNFKKISENCKNLMTSIIDKINCDIKVLIGPRVREWYNIKIKTDSKFINNFSGKYFLLSSPEENELKYKEGLEKILGIVKSRISTLSSFKNTISKSDKNLTLFDIKVIKNELLYIFCDEVGDKHYYVEKVEFPVYIKNGTYRDCNYLESDMNGVLLLTVEEKSKLVWQFSKALHQQIKLWN